MSTLAMTGNGATITGNGLGGWTGKIFSIGEWNETMSDINVSDLSTTGHEEYLPGDLIDHSTLSLTVQFDPQDVPTLGSANTITITFPDSSTLAGTGYVNGHGFSGLENNSRVEGTLVLRFNGATGPTYTAAP